MKFKNLGITALAFTGLLVGCSQYEPETVVKTTQPTTQETELRSYITLKEKIESLRDGGIMPKEDYKFFNSAIELGGENSKGTLEQKRAYLGEVESQLIMYELSKDTTALDSLNQFSGGLGEMTKAIESMGNFSEKATNLSTSQPSK